MSDDIGRRLEEAGRRSAPGPDPAFADALEVRLLAVARTAAQPPEPPRQPRLVGLRRLMGGVAFAVVAAVLALAVLAGRPVAAPELTEPVNVEVALVDGTVLEDPVGLRLPDGAVVSVGSGGSARVGDTVLMPGDVATIERGRVRVEHDQPVGAVPGSTRPTTPRPTQPPTPSPTRTPAQPARTPVPTAPSSNRPTPAPAGTPSSTPELTRPTAAPPIAAPPTATPTQRPTAPPPTAAPPTAAPPTAAPPTAAPPTVAPQLRAVAVGTSRVAAKWTRTRGAKTYVLVVTVSRGGRAARPVYPGSRVLGEFARPPVNPFRFNVGPAVTQVRLLVVALGRNGEELARSRVVRVTVGG